VVNNDLDNERAVNNIYKALDKLATKGLQKSVPVSIHQGSYGPTIRTTVKRYIVPIKSDLAILELADAINRAAEMPEPKNINYPAMKATIDMPQINITIPEIRIPEIKIPDIVVNVPEQPAAIINVNVPEQPAPIINVEVAQPVNNITIEQADIKPPKVKPVQLTVQRNADGAIIGVTEK
jgi:hypothetical protein